MLSFIRRRIKIPSLFGKREGENWTIAVETIGGMREREREVIFQIFLPNKSQQNTFPKANKTE